MLAAAGSAPPNPALPWAWIALYADTAFPMAGFSNWWQLRVLGKTFPSRHCPWCFPATTLTSNHLKVSCPTFAEKCWINGIMPEAAFLYPTDPAWFAAVLNITFELASAGQTLTG